MLILVLLVSHILRNWNPFETRALEYAWEPSGHLQMQRLYVEANEPTLYLTFNKLCIQYALKEVIEKHGVME